MALSIAKGTPQASVDVLEDVSAKTTVLEGIIALVDKLKSMSMDDIQALDSNEVALALMSNTILQSQAPDWQPNVDQ